MGCKKCCKDECKCKRGPRGSRGPAGEDSRGNTSYLIPYASGGEISLITTGSFIPPVQFLQFGDAQSLSPLSLPTFGSGFRAPVDLVTGALSIAFRASSITNIPFATLTVVVTITVTDFTDTDTFSFNLSPIATFPLAPGTIFSADLVSTGALSVPTGSTVLISLSAVATGEGISVITLLGYAQGGLTLIAV